MRTLIARTACALGFVFAVTTSGAQVAPGLSVGMSTGPTGGGTDVLARLVATALENNPELNALDNERRAARHRIAPAGALDDPMLEAGIVNLPVESWRFNREDMTMKMIGMSQRLPYPGKRELRTQIATKEAGTADLNYRETMNRIARDVKVGFFDLAYTLRSAELVERNRLVLDHFLRLAESRYALGQATQADVLKAQTQLAKMLDESFRVQRERSSIEAELARVVGRPELIAELAPGLPEVGHAALDLGALEASALDRRPQLGALQSTLERTQVAIELARKDYLPDFDVRVQYGQRDRAPDGMRREDMLSVTVAVSLPVWRAAKLDPKLAEAQAMRDQVASMHRAQASELRARLRQQVALAEQSQRTLRLYDTSILPQSHLTVEAALSAYRVNRVDMLTLLDNQMAIYGFELNRAQAIASYHKALAEIDFLTGNSPAQ